jgi:hypothetical protein
MPFKATRFCPNSFPASVELCYWEYHICSLDCLVVSRAWERWGVLYPDMITPVQTAMAIANRGPSQQQPQRQPQLKLEPSILPYTCCLALVLAALARRGCVGKRHRRLGCDVARSRKGGATHKSLNGNSLAIPPRTTNTATAKFTMRLEIVSLESRDCNGTAVLLLPSVKRPARLAVASTHKMSEKSMLEPERCGYRSLTSVCWRLGEKDG